MSVKDLLEPHITEKQGCIVEPGEWIFANKLLTPARLDICLKIIYLELKNKNKKYADYIYQSDIKMQTKGSYKEIGCSYKDSLEKYVKSFSETIDSISNYGFDELKSLIPLAKTGDILNGAHRLACSINAGIKVKTAKTNLEPIKRNYIELLDRQLDTSLIELATLFFIKHTDDVRIAFFWPRLQYDQEFESEKIEEIIYKKKISLSGRGKSNLIRAVYSHIEFPCEEFREIWLERKVKECFDFGDEAYIVFFRCESDSIIKDFKTSLRKKYNAGYSIIHTTDTKEEVLLLAGILLNENGLHFLNNSYSSITDVFEKARILKKSIELEGLDPADLAVDTSFILEMYGLRKSRDIDFVHFDKDFSRSISNIDIHQSCLKYHQVEPAELVFNPFYHFEVFGVKFISLEQVYYMKAVRNEEKDRLDCLLIRKLNRSVVSKSEYQPKLGIGVVLTKQLSNIYMLLDSLSDDNYIVYGAGTGARIVCSQIGSKISKIIDSNIKLQGSSVYGVPIFSPDELTNCDVKIIVTVLGREASIIKELASKYNINKNLFISLTDIS